jgi:hypothetical protein
MIRVIGPTPIVILGSSFIDIGRECLSFQNRLSLSAEGPWVVGKARVTKALNLNAHDAHETGVHPRWDQRASPEFVKGKKERLSLFHGDADSDCGLRGHQSSEIE